MNEILLFAEIAIFFSGILIIKKFYSLNGLYAWITLATCLAEIQVSKAVTFFGIEATLGNVLFASTFLTTDIIRENYGQEQAKKAPLYSLLGAVVYLIFALITPRYIPIGADLVDESMKVLFSFSFRITISSIFMLIVANYIDVILYEKLYQKMNGRYMWLRNNICTVICNCVENYIFTFLAFGGVFDLVSLMIIATAATCREGIIAILDTPFLYFSKKIK